MEVGRSTDGAVGEGRDAAEVTMTGPTDTTAAGAGVDETAMDGTGGKKLGRDAPGVTTTGPADTAAAGVGVDMTTTDGTGGKKKKKRRDKKRKHGGAAKFSHPSRDKRL